MANKVNLKELLSKSKAQPLVSQQHATVPGELTPEQRLKAYEEKQALKARDLDAKDKELKSRQDQFEIKQALAPFYNKVNMAKGDFDKLIQSELTVQNGKVMSRDGTPVEDFVSDFITNRPWAANPTIKPGSGASQPLGTVQEQQRAIPEQKSYQANSLGFTQYLGDLFPAFAYKGPAPKT